MIGIESIEALVEQYAKHNWILRRIVLTANEYDRRSKKLALRFEVEIMPGAIDGAWFSRINKGAEAWELRRLSGAPFAMVKVIEIDAEESAREAVLRGTETEMANSKAPPLEH